MTEIRRMRGMLPGTIAGTVATVPMTAFMQAGHRLLPSKERYPLPPRQITEQVTRKTDLPMPSEERRRVGLTLAAHFGYGAAAGALYGTTSAPTLAAAARRGILFGLVVWTVSYLGFLPALGLLSPATRHSWRRNVLMIAAHIVWGSVTGALTYAQQRPREVTSAFSTDTSGTG